MLNLASEQGVAEFSGLPAGKYSVAFYDASSDNGLNGLGSSNPLHVAEVDIGEGQVVEFVFDPSAQ